MDYLNLSNDQIDNLLLGLDLNDNKKEENNKICKSCNSNNLVIDKNGGFLVCTDCSVINKEIFDDCNEFNSEDNMSARYGCPSNFYYPQASLGTKIVCKGHSNMSMIHSQGQMPYKEKSLMGVLDKIQVKCKEHKISQPIIDSAKNLYKKINDSKNNKGKRANKPVINRCINRISLIAACVYYACKVEKEPRSLKEIASIYDIEMKNINKGCKKIFDYVNCDPIIMQITNTHPCEFIEHNIEKLNLEKKYIDLIKNTCENVRLLNLAGSHEPQSIAAGCVLLIVLTYDLKLTKKDIAAIFDISDVTITKTYKKIHCHYKIIMDNFITQTVYERLKQKLDK